MMLTIRCNLAFSMGLNFLAITLAVTGILNPVVGALVHNAGSVAVIINSALLLGWKTETLLLARCRSISSRNTAEVMTELIPSARGSP